MKRRIPWQRILDSIVALALPALCFVLAWDFGPDWQSGKLDEYAQLALSGHATRFLLPLLVLASGCLLATTWWWPATQQARPGVAWFLRWGLASGLLLAFGYHVLVVFSLFGSWSEAWFVALLTLVALPLLDRWPRWLARLVGWLVRRLGLLPFLVILAALLAVASIATALLDYSGSLAERLAQPSLWLLGVLFLGSLISAPAWVFWLCLCRIRALLAESGRRPLPDLAAVVAAVAGWLTGVELGYESMMAHYATLPTSPPDCFLATAAGRGHAALVGARPASCGGQVFLATPQLRRLKAAELLLLFLAPRTHAAIRRVYDRIGPRLAAQLRHAWQADLVWFAFKPAEWAARAVLRVVAPESRALVGRLWPQAEVPITPTSGARPAAR